MNTPVTLTTEKREAKRAHRSPHGPGWYVTDKELFELLGVPPEIGRQAIEMFDRNGGFPKKQAIFGGRRYLPAIQAFLDQFNNVKVSVPNDGGFRERSHAARNR